jgi:putative ABC transport system ATP-binding protein
VSQPELIFADEPTGNLDSTSGVAVLRFLRDAVDRMGQTIVMVTHDPAAASWADRAVFLADGQIVGDLPKPTAETVLAQMHKLDTRIMASQARDDR